MTMDGSRDRLHERMRERARRLLVNPRLQKVCGIFGVLFGLVLLVSTGVTQWDGGAPGWNGWASPILDIVMGLSLLNRSRHGGEPTGPWG